MCQKSRSLSTQVVFGAVYDLANQTFEVHLWLVSKKLGETDHSLVFVIHKYYFKWKFRLLNDFESYVRKMMKSLE